VYGFVGTAGKASDRTSLTTFVPNADGSCQTTNAPNTRTYTYDTADRIATTGTVYDGLGRTTVQAGSDTAPGSSATLSYYTNDMARTIAQNGRTATYTLDAIPTRSRLWTDDATGTVTTRTNHYTNDSDGPTWTDEGNSTWTRPVTSATGVAAIQNGPVGVISWQITNLHGDLVAGATTGVPGLSFTTENTEYGQPRTPADAGTRRYSWQETALRAADTPDGVTLMGVRLYNATTGRFLQVDPVPGGSANRYDYCNADPINCVDPSGKYGYSYSYRIGWNPWKSPATIMSIVSHAFNSYFPIPTPCTTLSVGAVCSLAGSPVKVEAMWSTGFRFLSMPGHVEGAGKRIEFTFSRSWGVHSLHVRAWGPDVTWCDKHWACASGNRLFTYLLWWVFAADVSNVVW
jgi:RHS repeat-associated protein